jgi:hypothetical protein
MAEGEGFRPREVQCRWLRHPGAKQDSEVGKQEPEEPLQVR